MSEPREVIDLLWEQHPCLVVNKPGGILSESPPGIDSLEDQVRAFLKRRESNEGNIYLGRPHRLDRPTSGAIVFARNSRATRRLSEQFQGRTVEKVYWALVEGHLTPDRGRWEDYMRKIPDVARSEIVPQQHPDARHAVLNYEVLRHDDYGTWLQIRLETGRTHQIRLQCATRGFPVLGDYDYGATTEFGPSVQEPRDRWIALHARVLGFVHPKSRQRVTVVAPLLASWLQLRPASYWQSQE